MDFDSHSTGTWHDCHVVDLELAKLRLLRGCQRVRFDFMGRNNNHLSPLPKHQPHQQRTSSLPSTHTLLQQHTEHRHIAASYHPSIVFCPHNFDIHPHSVYPSVA
jgi:hypothetical protein